MWKKAMVWLAFVGIALAYSADSTHTLVFFLNPNGRPCQMQNEILEQSRGEWSKYVNIRYVSTEVPSDRGLFYQFGIRALPSLVFVDSQGKEIQRFAPGIQSAENVVATAKKLGK